MRKIYSICLSLIMTGTMTANATNTVTANKWKKHNVSWHPISVQGMNKRTTTMQIKKVWTASAETTTDTPISSTQPAPGFGYLTGPDGTQWYYTQSFEMGSETYYYSKSNIKVFDSNNQQVGNVTVEVPSDMKVNLIEPFGDITKKMFDRDEKTYEMMVSLHAVGSAANNYKSTYTTVVYSLTGDKVAEYNGAGVFFDASKDWNTYQRLLVPRTIYNEDDTETYAIDVIAPPGWSETSTKVEHTFYIPDSLTNYDYGSYLNCFVVNDNPYYVISHYAKPYVSGYDPETWEMIVNENNSYVITTYDKNFNKVDELNIPIEKPEDALYRFAAFGMMFDKDLSEGYFTPKGERAYVVTFADYLTTSDSEIYDFVLYNNKGEKLKTICEDAMENQWWELSPIKGQSDQMLFLQANGSAQQIQMVDIPSCEKKTLIPATIDGVNITTELDRYPVGNSYQYVIKTAQADVDDNNNTIARIGWYTTDLKLDHMVNINLGPEGEYFTPLLNEQTLNPYLFNTDDKMEYIYLAKKKRTDGSDKVDNVLEIANEYGEILKSFVSDGDYRMRTPAVLAMTPTKNQLMIGLYNDDTEDYRLDFYDLPFTKFDKGGDGTADNPYIISTIGDLLQVNNEPSACYKMANNIDFANYKDYWKPISNSFMGTLDGDNNTMQNLTINTTENEVGLFSTVGTGSKIKNLAITNPTITVNADNQYVGIIAGEAAGDTITNVHIYNANIVASDSSNTDIAPSVGGFIGNASLYTEAQGSSFNGSIYVPASSLLGGIGGIFGETKTSSCVKACAVTGSITAMSNVGGIVGSQGTGSTINDCHVNAKLEAQNTVGGITGSNGSRGAINNCFAEGTVTATKAKWGKLAAGGIVGYLEPNWNFTSDVIIYHCTTAANIMLPEGLETDSTAHRIAGATVTNEEDLEDKKDKGLVGNYALNTVTVGGLTITSDDETSVDGKDAEQLDKALLTSLGYSFGSDIAAPWTDNGTPMLFFENAVNALEISSKELYLSKGESAELQVTLHGNNFDLFDCVSSNTDVAEVEISDMQTSDNLAIATVKINAKKAGTAIITATAGNAKAECLVIVGTNGITFVATSSPMAIKQSENMIVAEGATNIKVYSVGGQLTDATNASAISTTQFRQGVYVVTATDADGHKCTAKVIIK